MVYLSANLRTSNEDSPSYIYKYPDDFGDFSPRQALDLCIDGKEIRPPQRQSIHSIDHYNGITRISYRGSPFFQAVHLPSGKQMVA